MFELLKRLKPELLPHRSRLLKILFWGLIMSACAGAIPELIRHLVDRVFAEKRETELLIIPAAFFLIWLVQSYARFQHLFWVKYTADLVVVSLRKTLLDKYLKLSPSALSQFATGSGGLMSRMLNDINVVHSGVTIVADLFREPFFLVFLVINMVRVDWQLTLFSALGLPLVAYVLNRIKKSLRKHSYKNQSVMEDLTLTLKETLDGSRIIQSFNLEGEMRGRFNKQIDSFLNSRRKIIAREEMAGPITETIAVFIFAILIYYVGRQIFEGQFTIGQFTQYLTAMGMAQKPIKKIQDAMVKIQQTVVAMDRLDQVLKSESQVPQVARPKPFPRDWQRISFTNVCFSYASSAEGSQAEPVLRKLNLVVKKGEIVALVGESGSGKSTLVNLLQRFYDPTDGDISIDGVSLREMDLVELRKNIALVSQEVFLFSDTIERNIHSGDFSKPASQVEVAAKLANAHGFISRSPEGYLTLLGDRGSRVSGGEKQRISIARAIVKDAPILVLDEATSALDSASELEVQKGLDQLIEGKTAFIVAHRLSTIRKAHRILVLKQGEVIEMGDHDSLVKQGGEYSRFHQMQS